LHADERYQILISQSSIKDIKVRVLGCYWKDADRTQFPADAFVVGKLQRWISVAGGTLRAEWPDGWDTEDMHVLLLPEYKFELVSTGAGATLRRRGGGHPVNAPGTGAAQIGLTPKEKVIIPYKIGVQNFEQVWEVETDDIAKDARTEPRNLPTLKVDPKCVPDMMSMYLNVTLVRPIIEGQIKFINMRLSGVVTAMDKTNRFTTMGEMLRLRGLIGTAAIHRQCSRDELWRNKALDNDIFAPPDIGRFGLSKNRANKLLSLMWLFWNPDESDLDKTSRWRYVESFETMFNEYRLLKLTIGWLTGADELISPYEGKEGNPTVSLVPYISNPKLIPEPADFIPRKPKTTGKEIKCATDGVNGVMMRLELQRGKADHVHQKYYAEYGHTIAQCLRLTEPWHDTGLVFAADAWFGSVSATETLRSHGACAARSPAACQRLHQQRAHALTPRLPPCRVCESVTVGRYTFHAGCQDQLGALSDHVHPGEPRARVWRLAGPLHHRRERREALLPRPPPWRVHSFLRLVVRHHRTWQGPVAQGGLAHSGGYHGPAQGAVRRQ
jgi:hypothetical protein